MSGTRKRLWQLQGEMREVQVRVVGAGQRKMWSQGTRAHCLGECRPGFISLWCQNCPQGWAGLVRERLEGALAMLHRMAKWRSSCLRGLAMLPKGPHAA